MQQEKFRNKTRYYKVYHIHVKGNTDINEGYVGITRRSLSYRLSQHFHSKRPIGTILRSLQKENIVIDQLAFLPKDEALEMEYRLRPKRYIGWNVMAGGNKRTVKCTQCGKYLPNRRTGSLCEDCHPTKFTKGHIPHNYGKGRKYKLIDPNGNIFYPFSIVAFCKEHALEPRNLNLVAKGRRKTHKGWTATYVDIE